MNKNIEVEIRSFISKTKYYSLLKFFKKNSTFKKQDKQETIYFDSKKDLRIQKNNLGSKIWLKEGAIHDNFREEIEIHTEKKDFEKLQKLFKSLGYREKIKWLRKRNEFKWKGIKVCLDYTIGYGYIIELEKMSTEKSKKTDLELLKLKLESLKIKETPKEDFEKAFKYYQKNWKKLLLGKPKDFSS